MLTVRSFVETKFFGVCSYLGYVLRMPSGKIRLYFIYSTLFTVGSPVVIYLTIAFILNLKDYVKGQRSQVWDL
jgi:phage shock protein C